MLRFLIFPSLCLLILFSAIGLLFSRQWGWSEYASPELYLTYQEALNGAHPFFLVDAMGSGQRWKLSAGSGNLTALNCSPDGRTLAYLTDKGHLYVVNQAGIVYDRALGQGYDALAVANDGMIAASQTVYGIVYIISPEGSYPPDPPQHIAYDRVKIASSGATLWSHTAVGGIELVAPSGATVMTISSGAFSPVWLASERIFAFSYPDQASNVAGGLADTSRQMVVRFRNGILRDPILSPDATVEALPIQSSTTNATQIALVDPLTGTVRQQFGNDDRVDHLPICFLTFRPQILVSGSVSGSPNRDMM